MCMTQSDNPSKLVASSCSDPSSLSGILLASTNGQEVQSGPFQYQSVTHLEKVCFCFVPQVPPEDPLVPFLPSEEAIYCRTNLLPSDAILIMAFISLQGYISTFITLKNRSLLTKSHYMLLQTHSILLSTTRNIYLILPIPRKHLSPIPQD